MEQNGEKMSEQRPTPEALEEAKNLQKALGNVIWTENLPEVALAFDAFAERRRLPDIVKNATDVNERRLNEVCILADELVAALRQCSDLLTYPTNPDVAVGPAIERARAVLAKVPVS